MYDTRSADAAASNKVSRSQMLFIALPTTQLPQIKYNNIDRDGAVPRKVRSLEARKETTNFVNSAENSLSRQTYFVKVKFLIGKIARIIARII